MSIKLTNSDEGNRERIHRRYDAANRMGISVKHARKGKNIFSGNDSMRVGVYCRVSTGNTEQLTSYIMQKKYYSEYVKRHPNWSLIEIYADSGISGTSLNKRDEFIRMLKDCEEDKLDLIIVKSVSRFARCTEDFLVCIKNLTNHKPPIGVFFENEGIYTLDESKQMTLTLFASFAQEESHTKSTSMNSSVEQRFSHGIFLTPPLLGYGNDKDGNLIINEDEAETVRLIFSMYQFGYTCDIIAETLTVLGRKTKQGNTKWSSSTISGVLKNERHCGDVVARKTWTPNYLNHKSVKNKPDKNGLYDRNQYYKINNHPAIISRHDYIVVQKMITNAKYGGRSFMPELHVNSGGALHGFVSINPRWGAFEAADYLFASESVGESSRNEILFNVRGGEIDLSGYEIARTQLFCSADMTSGLFYSHSVQFSSECIRKLRNVEYVELLVHPLEKILVVRECFPEHRNAILWAKFVDGKAYTQRVGGKAYLDTLFAIFNWNSAWGYRLRGAIRNVAGNPVAFFDAGESEVFIPNRSTIAEDYYVTKCSKYRFAAMPVRWRHNFGVLYYRQALKNIKINKAGAGEVFEHNTEAELRPTTRENLVNEINRLLTKFRDKEADNGNKDI